MGLKPEPSTALQGLAQDIAQKLQTDAAHFNSADWDLLNRLFIVLERNMKPDADLSSKMSLESIQDSLSRYADTPISSLRHHGKGRVW